MEGCEKKMIQQGWMFELYVKAQRNSEDVKDKKIRFKNFESLKIFKTFLKKFSEEEMIIFL